MIVHGFRAKSFAEAESRILAQESLVAILLTDPRVERVYQQWRRTSGLAALIDQWQRTTDAGGGDDIGAELLLCYDAAGIVLRRVLLPPLLTKLPLPYQWLADRVHGAFMERIGNEAVPDALTFRAGFLVLPDHQRRRGRRAKGEGDSIRRGVEWFYRAHVQEPTESIRALAKEYTAIDRARRKSDGRSTVQPAIARAMALLAPLPK